MKLTKIIGAAALGILLVAAYAFIPDPGMSKPQRESNDKWNKMNQREKDKKVEKLNDLDKTGHDDQDDKKEKMKPKDSRDGKYHGQYRRKGDLEHKITICHKTGGHPVTISVSERAWHAHQAHGDVRGECRDARDKKDIGPAEEKRRKIYGTIAYGEDAIIHSGDVIEAAWERINKAHLSIEAARRSGRFTSAELKQREDRVVLVETRTSNLEDMVSFTRHHVTVNGGLVEVQL